MATDRMHACKPSLPRATRVPCPRRKPSSTSTPSMVSPGVTNAASPEEPAHGRRFVVEMSVVDVVRTMRREGSKTREFRVRTRRRRRRGRGRSGDRSPRKARDWAPVGGGGRERGVEAGRGGGETDPARSSAWWTRGEARSGLPRRLCRSDPSPVAHVGARASPSERKTSVRVRIFGG